MVDNVTMESVPSCYEDDEPSELRPDERDPDVLRAALTRETVARRRADCLAKMQAEVVQLALDLLVREPDIYGFFGALTRTMVEEGESHACGVWLIDDDNQRCDLWMAFVKDRLYKSGDWQALAYPRESMGRHLFSYAEGWTQTIEYQADDPRLPESVREFHRQKGVQGLVIAPLVLGSRNLGWIALTSAETSECWTQWWRVMLIEAIAR